MKNKKLHDYQDQQELSFRFNRRQIPDKNIEKHWLRIASRISGTVLPKEIKR